MQPVSRILHRDGGRDCPSLDDVPEDLVDFSAGYPVMRQHPDGSCIALRAGACTIYSTRPLECRHFKRGSPDCRAAQLRVLPRSSLTTSVKSWMTDRGVRRKPSEVKVPGRVARAWARVPRLACKGLCADIACGSWYASQAELRLIEKVTPVKPTDHKCPLLMNGRCSVYEVRPLICRAWGTTPMLACPHGCEPEEWIGELELADLFERLHGEDSIASPWAGMPCLDCGKPITGEARDRGFVRCAECFDPFLQVAIPYFETLMGRGGDARRETRNP